MELAAQAEHEDDLPENLSEITDLWNSPARTHGTFGREPSAAKPEDDRYLRAAIQEYDNIAKLGQIMREGPIKVSDECGHSTKGVFSHYYDFQVHSSSSRG
ncbi:cadherin-23-like [Melanerpes formicivorus]|uniref:cadherin-23-like n=1 Tax=Melanerpes formicivorus TaxID=211600 RepID=UPI00358F2D13